MVVSGILYLLLLFVCCFAAVHIVKLAYVGFKSLKKKPEVKKEEPKPEKKPQPVYYIVEKKRARKSYSPPREIEFK